MLKPWTASLLVVITAGTALVTPPVASAKGPSMVEATIIGPGMKAPIVLGDPDGEMGLNNTPDSERLSLFIEQTGIRDVVYGRKGVTSREPTGRLGRRFTVTWTLASVIGYEGSIEEIDEITSYLYPYAEQGPVMFTEGKDVGGSGWKVDAAWSHAPPVLLENLVAWGIPDRREVASRGERLDDIVATPYETVWSWFGPIIFLIAVAAGLRIVSRRRQVAH
ncbi:MAG: hypothetical protein GEU78_02735 [Actinobacteria bacterium]|nr:hypothetical protein [Actinomycetota bacterium]